ncbi:MAG: hypothetical protein VX871_06255, partial [Pseudomonadota bacterium]|nr:hypothetical protein [Pseudomonadota bacterium]
MDALTDKPLPDFSAESLRRRAMGVLEPAATVLDVPTKAPANRGDFSLNPDLRSGMDAEDRRRPAAVLVPIVDRGGEATVLLTLRPEHLGS